MIFNGANVSKKKIFFSLVGTFLFFGLIGATIWGISHKKESTDNQTKAVDAPTGSKQLAINLTAPSLYFGADYKTQTPSKPSTIGVSGTTYTISGKGGLVFDNPLKNEPFYKISVTMVDTDSKKVEAYLIGVQQLWGQSVAVKGISAGLNAPVNPAAYQIDNTERSANVAKLTTTKQPVLNPRPGEQTLQYPSEKEMADLYWSRFIKRHTGDVQLDLYVTPIGTYAVIDNYNTFSLPKDFAGSPVLSAGALNYIVLSKWDTSSDAITFKNLSVKSLDASVDTIDEVNAYFIKKAFDETYPYAKSKMADKSLSWAQAEQVAWLLRGYDYYFASPGTHKPEVVQLLRYALNDANPSLRKVVADNLPRYNVTHFIKNSDYNKCMTTKQAPLGTEQAWEYCMRTLRIAQVSDVPFAVNHSFMNGMAGSTLYLLGVSDYIDSGLREEFRAVLAPVIDTSAAYIFPKAPNGTYDPNYFLFEPTGNWYQGDTAMEEYSWLINVYAGYFGMFYYDNDPTTRRISKVLEWLIFLDHHGYSEQPQSLATAFGSSIKWEFLPPPALTFTTQTVWSDGKIDNHDMHQSVNYGVPTSSDYARTILKRIGGLTLPTVRTNQRKILENSFKAGLDLTTLRRKVGTVGRIADFEGEPNTTLFTRDTVEMEPTTSPRSGMIKSYHSTGTPSLLEDWGNSFIYYAFPLAQGDTAYATTMARNVYYGFYNSRGRLLCMTNSYAPTASTCLTNDPLSNYFDGPLTALMFDPSSKYSVWPDNGFSANVVSGTTPGSVPGSAAQPSVLSVSNNKTTFAKAVEIGPTGYAMLKTEVPISGNVEVNTGSATPVVIPFTNGTGWLPASKLGSAGQFVIKIRPALDSKYSAFRIANSAGIPWTDGATITVKAGAPVITPTTPVATPNPAPVSPTPSAADVSYTQQLYRELTGSVPVATDATFKAITLIVMSNDCLSAVNSISKTTAFQQRKSSYTNAQFVTMLFRAVLNRQPTASDVTVWVDALVKKYNTRENLAAKLYTFPEAQSACKSRKLIVAAP